MDSTETKNKIIAGAKQIFLTKGFAESTLDEISSVSGVNQALINYHFRTKKFLYRLTVLQVFETEIYPEMSRILNIRDDLHKANSLNEYSSAIFKKYPFLMLILLNENDAVFKDLLDWMIQKVRSSEFMYSDKTPNISALHEVQRVFIMFTMSLIPESVSGFFKPLLGVDDVEYKQLLFEFFNKIVLLEKKERS